MSARAGRRHTVVLAAALALSAAATSSAAERLPRDFADEPVAAVPQPTAIAFTPDAEMLVASKSGEVRLKPAGRPLDPEPALDVSSRVCPDWDSGLMGVAVDPQFAWNRFVYLYYTRLRSRDCRTDAVNRLSRFVLAGSARRRARSERVLLDNIRSPTGIHNAGDLHFGKDGFLYVSIGDGGCHPDKDLCGPENPAAREPHHLLGKIIRIDRDGNAPPENGGDARCAMRGAAAPGRRCQEIFASGLRNPFRMAFDPNAQGTRFYINDVGRTRAEEINAGRLGADYGWPLREGRCRFGPEGVCGAPPSELTDPLFDYPHSSTCKAITGGAFVPQGVWPARFDGAYLFADWICGRIWRLSDAPDGRHVVKEFVTGLGERSPVHLTFGPGPGAEALYYATWANGGELRMLHPTRGNRRPVARMTTEPVFGRVPLDVRYDARSSWDPDAGDRLRFHWRFGDGRRRVTRKPTVAHRYRTRAVHIARLTVGDGTAMSDPVDVRIFAGDRPPAPGIRGPRTYRSGQTLMLRGAATDPEDGRLRPRRLRWTVDLHHGSHRHPYAKPSTGATLRIRGAAPEDARALRSSFLRVTLTATDRHGLAAVATHDLLPRERVGRR